MSSSMTPRRSPHSPRPAHVSQGRLEFLHGDGSIPEQGIGQEEVEVARMGRDHRHPTAAGFRAHNRGGGLFTVTVNQRIGSYLCIPAHRLSLTPSALTLANLVIGVTAAILVAILSVETRGVDSRTAALVGFVLWQLAYSLDCADGQLARFTGRASSAGARLDVLCDMAVQVSLVVAICISTYSYDPNVPYWLLSAFGSVAVINLCISTLVESGPKAGSLFADKSRTLVQLASLAVDYGTFITVFPAALAFAPTRLDDLMALFVVGNLAFLAIRIAIAAQASMKSN